MVLLKVLHPGKSIGITTPYHPPHSSYPSYQSHLQVTPITQCQTFYDARGVGWFDVSLTSELGGCQIALRKICVFANTSWLNSVVESVHAKILFFVSARWSSNFIQRLRAICSLRFCALSSCQLRGVLFDQIESMDVV